MDDRDEQKRSAEPPAVYFPACGVLCDVFWWARRPPEKESPAGEIQPARDAK